MPWHINQLSLLHKNESKIATQRKLKKVYYIHAIKILIHITE
jgi:hypothetical protein